MAGIFLSVDRIDGKYGRFMMLQLFGVLEEDRKTSEHEAKLIQPAKPFKFIENCVVLKDS